MSELAFKLEGSWPCQVCGNEGVVRTVIYYASEKTSVQCIHCYVEDTDNFSLAALEASGDKIVQIGEILVVNGEASYVVYWPWSKERLANTPPEELSRIVETFYRIQLAAIKD